MKGVKQFMIGFRKLFYGVLFFTVSLILLLFDIVTGEEWIKYNSGVVTAFFATNIGEHLVNVGKDWVKDRITRTNMDIIKEVKNG